MRRRSPCGITIFATIVVASTGIRSSGFFIAQPTTSDATVAPSLPLCTPTEWLVVDDVTRVGLTLELSMHIESFDLGPATFGRPWVVVQVPIGDYDGVVHNLYE